MLEYEIENYLCQCALGAGGEVRKVAWVGRRNAPDRLLMLPAQHDPHGPSKMPRTIWVELKKPGLAATFPADAHERAQDREHQRMREMGQRVEVIDSKASVDELLA